MASIESGELTFVDGTAGGTRSTQLIALTNGNTLLMWVGGTAGGGQEVFGKILDPAGRPVGAAFQLSQNAGAFVGSFDTARIDDGHIAIVFNATQAGGGATPIRAAVFDPAAMANGGAIPATFTVATPQELYSHAAVEAIGDDLVFLWQANGAMGSGNAYGTVLDAATHQVVTAQKTLFGVGSAFGDNFVSLGGTVAVAGADRNGGFVTILNRNLDPVEGGRYVGNIDNTVSYGFGSAESFHGGVIAGFNQRSTLFGTYTYGLEVVGEKMVGSWNPPSGTQTSVVPYVVGDRIVAVYGHKAQVLSHTSAVRDGVLEYTFKAEGPEFTIESSTYPDDIVGHGAGFLAVWHEGVGDTSIVGQFFTNEGTEAGLFTGGDYGGELDAGTGTSPLTGNVLDNDLPETGGGKTVTAVDGKAVGTDTVIVGTYGTLTISANGQYSYKADRPAAIALTENESETETFTYRAKTGDGDEDTAQVSFNVNGVFDGGARNVGLTSNTVTENGGPGSEVGKVTFEAEEAFTYALANNTGKPFKIDANGVITTTKVLDREAVASYSVTVQLTGERSDVVTTKTFTIGVTDVNEAPGKPTFTSAYKKDGFGFYELTTKSTGTFGKLAAVDPERGAVSYVASVTAYNGGKYSPSTKFKVVGNELRVNGALADDFYYVSVYAKDAAGNVSVSSEIQIDVDAPNTVPVITSNGGGSAAAITISENTKAVTTVKATDKDAHTTLTYSLATSKDKAFFAIDAKTGVLTFKTAPNYEAPKDSGKNNVYDVTVQVSDGAATDTQALAVKVKDVGGPAKGAPVSHGDTFVFETGDAGTAPGSWAKITGFTRGEDLIDLSGIDADPARGDQALRFVDHFSAAKGGQPDGQVRVVDHGRHVKVEIDYDGDGGADMILQVLNVAKLTAGDFIL